MADADNVRPDTARLGVGLSNSNTKSPIELRIPPQGYVELEQLATHAGKLQDVVAVSATLPLNDNLSHVSNVIAERLNVDPDVATSLLSGLASLHALMKQSDATAEEILKTITQALLAGKADEWIRRNFETWQQKSHLIANALASITEDHTLLLRQKALELTYAHQNIFKRCQIMTDLRPVFNAVGDAIHAMVLTHVLSVEYFDGVRGQRIEFALDEADVEELRKSAERAKRKTDTAKEKFAVFGCPLVIAGNTSR